MDLSDTVLLINEHLTKDASQETLFETDDPWLTNKNYTKLNILICLDIIKLSNSQYITTFIINYGPYVGSKFALENFTHNFCKQLINIINSNPFHKT